MRTSLYRLAVLAGLVWAAGPWTFAQAAERDVTLYIPAFEGAGQLGFRVATVLNLQIWQTLRRAPFPNPAGLSFGNGTVLWDPIPPRESGHVAAETAAQSRGADATLWGRAWRYGGGVVVQAYLTLAAGRNAEERIAWKETVRADGKPVSLTLRLPRRRYEFSPIVLRRDVVESFASPAGLRMVATRGTGNVVGEVGDAFRALRHEGSWTLVRSGSAEGWVHLPQLSERRSEIVDFSGGLVRLLRTDWLGARELLQRVVDNSNAPSALRVDALLILGLIAQHAGGDPLGPILRAHQLNPHDVEVTKYECMAYVNRISRAGSEAAHSQTKGRLRDILSSRSYQFGTADPWFSKVQAIVKD